MPSDAITARHFEIFLTMVVSRNMADAADALGISVAGVSKSLKILERETGLTLFRAAGGRLVPTLEAEQLVPYAQQAIDHLNRARRAAQALKSGEMAQIIIGVAGPALLSLVPSALKRFRQNFPDVRIDLRIDRTPKIIERVVSGEVDCGIGTPPVQDIDGRALGLCHVRDICDAPLCAVLPQDHPLISRNSLRPTDLVGEPLIALSETSATTRLVAAMFQQARATLEPVAVVENAVGVCALVQSGIGIGLINPLMLAGNAFPGIVLRPFRPRVVLRTCTYTARGRSLPPPLQAFLTALDQAAQEARRTLPA